jgi:hypothetical protein
VTGSKVEIVDKAHMPLVAFSLKGNPVYTVFEVFASSSSPSQCS